MPPPVAQAVKPLKRLAFHSTVTCAPQASIYGKCIVSNYTDVSKDLCREEFQLFKRCVHESMKK